MNGSFASGVTILYYYESILSLFSMKNIKELLFRYIHIFYVDTILKDTL